MDQLPVVHSNDGFTQLEEVWLGDVYPHAFYDHLEPAVRDVFYRITDITRQDLDTIQRRLEDFGVRVQRPIYRAVDDHLDEHGQLRKPEITPRDHYVALGQELIMPRWVQHWQKDGHWPWQHVINRYASDTRSIIRYHDLSLSVNGANTVRVGLDLFVDCVYSRHCAVHDLELAFQKQMVPFFRDRRCHFLDNGGHIDACFSILRPGLILANQYFNDYDRTFPGWKIILRTQPEFQTQLNSSRHAPRENHKWWLPDGIGNRAFNDHVIKHAQDWVGNYTETFFEVNCLVVNPKHVLMLGDNPALYQHLKQLGITAHSLPFRCRTFWDGGLHCLTLDIRRQGHIVDYFANTY